MSLFLAQELLQTFCLLIPYPMVYFAHRTSQNMPQKINVFYSTIFAFVQLVLVISYLDLIKLVIVFLIFSILYFHKYYCFSMLYSRHLLIQNCYFQKTDGATVKPLLSNIAGISFGVIQSTYTCFSRACSCVYQRIRNGSFFKTFAYVLN